MKMRTPSASPLRAVLVVVGVLCCVVPSFASEAAQAVPEPFNSEWLVAVGKKGFGTDLLAVLEDMGDHLDQRFGMREWFDVPALRESRRRHAERMITGGDGEVAEWRIQAHNEAHGLMALELGKRMMVKITIPKYMRAREEEIVGTTTSSNFTTTTTTTYCHDTPFQARCALGSGPSSSSPTSPCAWLRYRLKL
jgi:hypothetical protein